MDNTNNSLCSLHNMMYQEMQRLSNPELCGDALKIEVERAKAMANLGQTIIANGALILKSQDMMAEHHSSKLVSVPKYLLCEEE